MDADTPFTLWKAAVTALAPRGGRTLVGSDQKLSVLFQKNLEFKLMIWCFPQIKICFIHLSPLIESNENFTLEILFFTTESIISFPV